MLYRWSRVAAIMAIAALYVVPFVGCGKKDAGPPPDMSKSAGMRERGQGGNYGRPGGGPPGMPGGGPPGAMGGSGGPGGGPGGGPPGGGAMSGGPGR